MLASDEQIAFHHKKLEEYKPLQRAIQVIPGYSCLGDANNIPGPNIRHPRGVRRIARLAETRALGIIIKIIVSIKNDIITCIP